MSTGKGSPVIVIGAGIGGLATAARLARAGHQVEIHEASGVTGGKCQTEWINGYAFDTGPSLLTLDRKSTRLNSSHVSESRMPSSA